MWLHGKSENTVDAYIRDVKAFLDFAGGSFREVRLEDLQAYADDLAEAGTAQATQARKLAAIKSLFTFGHNIGYLQFNVGRAVKLPKLRDRLAERILTEEQVQRMIALESNPRNKVMLRVMYAAGLRVSEITDLRWQDVHEREKGGQISVHGKGEKTRHVLLSPATWRALSDLQEKAVPANPVFASQKGGALSRMQVYRIVREAADRAGIEKNVSPHWLRHAHASHSLDRGAGVHLVQQTLGHASLVTTSRYTHARPDDSSGLYLSM